MHEILQRRCADGEGHGGDAAQTAKSEVVVKILDQMLVVEVEARKIVEDAKEEANTVRKKAREDAKQLVINGKNDFERRIRQEITQLEQEAERQKEQIAHSTKTSLSDMERLAKERIDKAVAQVLSQLLSQYA